MGFASRGLTDANILDAITDDSTRFSGGDITTIDGKCDTITSKIRYKAIEWWSDPIAPFNVTGALTDINLNSVTPPSLTGISVWAAHALLRIAWIKDDSASDNALNINTVLQADKAAAGWVTCITIPANSLEITGSAIEPCGIVFEGAENIFSKVAMDTATTFRLYQIRATASNLILGGVQTGLKALVY